jgi:hypothetical protein
VDEQPEDAFERFMYARSQLADVDRLLGDSRLTMSRTLPLYSDADLSAVGENLRRYAAAADRLSKAADMLGEAVDAPSHRAQSAR